MDSLAFIGMESLAISVGVAMTGTVATFAVLKSNVQRMVETSKELSRKIDGHSNSLAEMKEKINQSPTMKEVRDEFVTKEVSRQIQKHIDEKFDQVDKGLVKIFNKLDGKR